MSAYPPQQQTGNGNSQPLFVSPPQNMQWQAAPAYALGLIVTLSPGASLTYSIQLTADPLPSNNSGNWNDHDVLTNLTASANSNVAFPITGLRIVVTNWISGTVNLGVAQWP